MKGKPLQDSNSSQPSLPQPPLPAPERLEAMDNLRALLASPELGLLRRAATVRCRQVQEEMLKATSTEELWTCRAILREYQQLLGDLGLHLIREEVGLGLDSPGGTEADYDPMEHDLPVEPEKWS